MEKMMKQQKSMRSGSGWWQKVAGNRGRIVEGCWLVVTLVLFIIMGPFAAPVALFAVLGLPPEERGEAEPEMLSEPVQYQLR